MGLKVIAAATMGLDKARRNLVVAKARGQTQRLLDITGLASWDGVVVDGDRPADGSAAAQ